MPKLVASSSLRRRKLRRLPAAVVVLGVVAAVGAAITGAAVPLPALRFVSPGHWVYSAVLGSAVHVDGATGSVDASALVEANPGAQVVQGEDSGYVIDSGKITVFGKSDLNVSGTMAAPSNEVPLAVEGAGGPYFVFRESGKVTRLGAHPVSIITGGPVTDPVLTADGTMWLLRKDGRVCQIQPQADVLGSCPAVAPSGHTGALSLLVGHPNYVDTTDGLLYQVGENGFGPATKLNGPTGPRIKASGTDVNGRLALLDPDAGTLTLVDPNAPTAAPVTVPLPKDGDFVGPAAGGSAVTVVDRKTRTVLTYDDQGNERDHKVMPKEAGEPTLTRGDDDHVYVEGDKSTHVMVVGDEGKLSDVPLDRAPARPDGKDKGGKQQQQREPDVPVTTPPSGNDRDVRSENQQEQQEQHKPKPPEHGQDQPGPSHSEQPEPPPPPVVEASPPGAPSGVRADAGQGSATVHWSAADANGSAVTGYHVTWKSSAGGGSRDVGAASRSVTVSGLTNGTSYTFSVAAKNKAGLGASASAKATPVGKASAPTVTPLYDAGNGSALVNWTQPSLGGGTLVHYLVDATGTSQRTTTSRSTLYANGSLPSNGDVTFTVRAVTRTSSGEQVVGAPGSFTAHAPAGPTITITRGEKVCPDHEDEPTCARMHVVMTGFEPNTEYAISPHSSNGDYHADDAHYTMDDNGSRTFDTFQYYWVGDTVWVSAKANGDTIESNHMTWTAS